MESVKQNNSEAEDERLWQSLRQGCEPSFTELLKKHWYRLYKVAYAKVDSKEIAEEITQEVFMNLWEKRERLIINNNIYVYLYTCVKNKSLNHLRTLVSQRKYWEYYKNFIPTKHETTDSILAFENLYSNLEKELTTLPDKTQKIFRLNRLEGKHVSEIADSLNISSKNVEYHITKSIHFLRTKLKYLLTLLFSFFVSLI